MRIVIDIQSLQSSSSANRGIGRYSRSLIEAMLRISPEDDFILLMNDMVGDDNDRLRREFTVKWPNASVRVWSACVPAGFSAPKDNARAAVAVREAVIKDCAPDAVLITSLFEGLDDDCVTTIGDVPTFVILYDLIPLIFSEIYLEDPHSKAWYESIIGELQKATHLLAISACSAQDAINYLSFPQECVTNISSDVSDYFSCHEPSAEHLRELEREFGLARPFLMYTGGIDHRKNIEGLITAYAALPKSVIADHQLAIVCKLNSEDREKLLKQAGSVGLPRDAVIMTGYVSDDTLVSLYNMCKAFVFPSWYEGFGLPVLEAMRCGAAVIGANVSSIPEVIGRNDSLFDPHSTQDMARVIEKVLTDESFRQSLRDFAPVQAQRFSWEKSARRTLAVIKDSLAENDVKQRGRQQSVEKPRLAFVSPLPPERSGISFYSAELLPALSQHYEIDLIVEQETVSEELVNHGFKVRDAGWLRRHARNYDRVIYQFGNSTFHSHMFDLVADVPGVVVLHDFFLSNIERHMDAANFTRLLGEAHGYQALVDRYNTSKTRDGLTEAVQFWPVNVRAVRSAKGVIVHSEASRKLASRFYNEETVADWCIVPLVRGDCDIRGQDRKESRRALGIQEDEFLICSFGYVSPSKLPFRLIDGLLASGNCTNPKIRLVFVGDAKEVEKELSRCISNTDLEGRVQITGWASDEVYKKYLLAADIAVQLRTNSRGESSAAVLDCQNYGIPTIVNANGSMADIPEHTVLMIPDSFSDEELAEAIDRLVANRDLRRKIGRSAREVIATNHSPASCSLAYRDAIEAFYSQKSSSEEQLVRLLAALPEDPARDKQLAQAVADSFPSGARLRQLFVDVSVLAAHDANTDIQRVVRAILGQWLSKPPAGWRIEPVVSDPTLGRYRYARQFTCAFLGIPDDWAEDCPIDYYPGDSFIGLDLNAGLDNEMFEAVNRMAVAGVRVSFVVYDMLPVLLPHNFDEADVDWYTKWLRSVSRFEHLVCISNSVADEVQNFLIQNPPSNGLMPSIGWFHLGADFESVTTKNIPPPNKNLKTDHLGTYPRFLMVGTIEPRKGHSFVLDAFEQFWATGGDATLIVVGKQGWKVDALCKRLQSHPEAGKRLFWIQNCSDAELKTLYSSSHCLIAASEGEGFGLPLIEASRHGLPILARDIPVFREVASIYATYFEGTKSDSLSEALKAWIVADQAGLVPRSDEMRSLSWSESAKALLRVLSVVD